MDNLDISIIIVNYNTTNLVEECIESIFRLTKGIKYEIIVVDNMSQDRSIERVEEIENVKLIKNKKNYGFGKANNIGIKEATAEYIFLLNSDTKLLNNAIKILYDNYLKIKNIGALTSILKDQNGNENYSYGRFPTLKNVILPKLKYYLSKLFKIKTKKLIDFELKEVDFVSGAALFIKKDIFQKVNGFDENFFMYYEETDLQFRLKKLGYKNYIINGPEIVHYDGSSWRQRKNSRRMIADKSMFYYFKKNNKKEYLLLKIMYLLILFITSFKYKFSENKEYLRAYKNF